MKQQEVFKKIGNIIKEIKDQYDYLSADHNSINDLELELFVANAHFLTDHLEVLRKLNKQNQLAALPAYKEEIKEEPVVRDPEPTPAFASPPAAETFAAPVIELPAEMPVHEHEDNLPIVPQAAQEQNFFEPVVQQHEPELPPATEDYELPAHPGKHVEQTPHPLSAGFDLDKKTDTDDGPAPHIDLSDAGSDRDSYSFIRREPEVIRHELNIDEADLYDEAEEETHTPVVPHEPAPQVTTPHVHPASQPEPPQAPVYKAPEPSAPVEEKPVYETPKPIEPASPQPGYQQPAPAAEEEKVLTINQRISAQLSQQTQSPLNTQKITDLKSAITLNDKLMFVKDLFNGYSLAYSEAIEILNRFNNFDDAERFLKTNYYTKNNWEGKLATVEKFYDLLRRRFA